MDSSSLCGFSVHVQLVSFLKNIIAGHCHGLLSLYITVLAGECGTFTDLEIVPAATEPNYIEKLLLNYFY